ncbi:MAG: class I SAM-dependent methyltransferase [Prosthecobacter sp.]|jgi:SAM-dependent methyltransferase
MPEATQRTPERLRHHFEVEKELAARLRRSTRAERTALFKTLYGELFERVPDHPRLSRRDTPEASQLKVQSQLRLLHPYLKADTRFLEFAPGDCRLAAAVAERVRKVIGVDISDQRAEAESKPDNLELIVYDGYELNLPDGSVDVLFSYQFLEHLHPDDVDAHFKLARRLLKPGGVYVFDTPHRFSGPHDVSRHFGSTLQCFHFQEWTYREMRKLLTRHGFSKTQAFRFGKPINSRILNKAHEMIEGGIGMLPLPLRSRLSSRLLASVAMIGTA